MDRSLYSKGMAAPKEEDYNALVFQLGDLARERLGGRPNAPSAMSRVLTAEEAVSTKEAELQAINSAMDEEAEAYKEFCQACEDEKLELEPVIAEFKKAVAVAEDKYKKAREKISAKENDLKHSKMSVQKVEEKVKELEKLGERKKAAETQATIKQLRMDVMRRQREIREMVAEADAVMSPQEDDGPSNAIRAKHRTKDLEHQLEEREKQYNEALAELDQQAAEKEQEINAARDYYDQAIFLLGEECYSNRINDASLVPLYLKLDKLSH
jgi:chromosome segregation ATPase